MPGTSRDRLQVIVRETPSVAGFSYPLLRLLVDKARELEKAGDLTKRHVDGSSDATKIGVIVLEIIGRQLKGGYDKQDWSDHIRISVVTRMLEAAEILLTTFEK